MREDFFELAVKKLRARSYSEAEIRQYLSEAGASSAEAEEVLQRLIELSYLDDYRVAENVVRSLQRGKAGGRLYWQEKLRKRGIRADIIEEILAGYSGEEEYRKALELAITYLQGKAKQNINQKMRGLTALLLRRGFSEETVQSVIMEQCDKCHLQG